MSHRILVLGGGYTGVIAAGRLARRLHPDDVRITLVSAEPDFVERIRLHQLAVGQSLTARPLDALFAGTGVEVRRGVVTALDPDAANVTVRSADGDEVLGYDTLVHALGSQWDTHDTPGVAEHAHDVAGRPGALRLQQRLTELEVGARVVVVGGGLTGLEAASEIAEARPDLQISLVVRRKLGSWLSPAGQRHCRTVLARLGIEVHEGAEVTAVEAAQVIMADGDRLPAEVTVWTAGFAVHPLAGSTTLDAPNGQIVVDATMRSVSHPDVHVVGDAALAAGPGGAPLRMSCASGVPAAWQAADAIAARLTGRRVPRVPVRYVNQCISLGRRDGLIQYVTADDRAVPVALTGRIAAWYKEMVCRGAAWGVANPLLGRPVRRHRIAASREREAEAVPA